MLAFLGWVVSVMAVFDDSDSLGWPDTYLLPSIYMCTQKPQSKWLWETQY